MRSNVELNISEIPLNIFLGYANEDEDLRNQLGKHLSILEKNGKIEFWSQHSIFPGALWEKETFELLNKADIILLLISSDFLASEHHWKTEIKIAIKRHQNKEAIIIPIILRSVDWENTPFRNLKPLPEDKRPITLWNDFDAACTDVAMGIRKTVQKRLLSPIKWNLVLDSSIDDFTETQTDDIVRLLRKLAKDETLELLHKKGGSVQLKIQSTLAGYKTILHHKENGSLENNLSLDILDLSKEDEFGAVVNAGFRKIQIEDKTFITSLPEDRLVKFGELGFLPLVMGIVIPLDNPIEGIGLNLAIQEGCEISEQETVELNQRLARYFKTFWIVTGNNINADLSPYRQNSLPQPLQRTELGRDLLAQDLLLKRLTASLLHPESKCGKTFWNRMFASGLTDESLETCFRVWILPGDVGVEQELIDGTVHVKIDKMIPKVLCESDYLSLAHNRGNADILETNSDSKHSKSLQIFKEIVLPEIHREISMGKNFGLLRQILSVMIFATWYKRNVLPQLMAAPQAAEQLGSFFDSNQTEKYGLDVVDPESYAYIYEEYKQLFNEGVWRCVHQELDFNTGNIVNRLYFSGRISASII